MNTAKCEKNRKNLRLASIVLFFLLIFPPVLSASHFRYGTMSWENQWDNGTIRLNMDTGWRTGYTSNYATVGNIMTMESTINWGDGNSESVQMKVISIDSNEGSSLMEIGSNSTGSWVTGVEHTYTDNGTYIISWSSTARISSIKNMADSSAWRIESKVNIGGSFTGNISPVSAVAPIVQIQDNTEFLYQLVATDSNGDSLGYRWGTYQEFVDNTSSSTYSPPTGMTLSNSGLVTWDVQDSGGQATDEDDMWLSFIMVEDLDSTSGDNKSYIPLDFFFKIASASNNPPVVLDFPTDQQTVSIGDNKTFTFSATDDSGVAPSFSVSNPPSDNSSIWYTSSSSSGGTTTFSISFAPIASMDNASYAVYVRATDNASMTKDQSLGIIVTSVSNEDPTAPTLVSPSDGSTVIRPVSFQWTQSTDADNDAISYKLYVCTNSSFTGCSGTTVAGSINLMPPRIFEQYSHDSQISWPRYLVAAPIYKQITQDLSTIPKWLIMLTSFLLLGILISFSLKNTSNRKLFFMLILLILFFGLNLNSCANSENSTSETAITSSSDESDTSSTSTSTSVTINDMTYTTSDLTGNNTTYYWKVVASDTKGGSASSTTASFIVQ